MSSKAPEQSPHGSLNTWRRYLFAMALGAGAAFTSLVAAYAGLAVSGNLPPPGIANSLCIDEKLSFFRENGIGRPNLLVIGSSVAWRHVDSSVLERLIPGVVPRNAGFCGLPLTQTTQVARWLLGRLPAVRQVILVTSPMDLSECGVQATSAFDTAEADRFVFRHIGELTAYLRFFQPVGMIRNAMNVAERRNDVRGFDPLIFTRHGDGPFDPPARTGLIYNHGVTLDPLCFEALRALATDLARRGIDLVVVSTPLHPDWKARYDADGVMRARIDHGIETAIRNSGARYWNGERAYVPGREAFIDAIHIRWPAAGAFTELLAQDLIAHAGGHPMSTHFP